MARADLVEHLGAERVRRQHAGRVAGVDAGLLDVLHDPADPDVLAVADRVDVDLDRVLQEAVEEDLALRAACARSSRPASPRRRRAPSRARRARSSGARAAGSRRPGAAASASSGELRQRVRRRLEVQPLEQRAEAPAVLGEVDRLGLRAEQRHARGLQAGGEPQRRLAAEGDDHALGLLDLDDRQHVLERQRLEVQPVRRVVVGRDRLRVAVDHHRVAAGLAHGHRRVHAAVVELDALADPVRAGAEDHHARLVAAADLGLGRVSSPRPSSSTASRPRTRRRRCRPPCRCGRPSNASVERRAARAGTRGRCRCGRGSRRRPTPRRCSSSMHVEAVRAGRLQARQQLLVGAGRRRAGRRARASAAPCRTPGRTCARSPSPRPPTSCASRASASTPGNFSNANRGHLTTT